MLDFLPRLRSWLNLCKTAPALNKLQSHSWKEHAPPPKRMSNYVFLQLAAAFNDHVTRDALRQLIVDLLKDRDPITRAELRLLILELLKDDLTALLTRILNQRNRQ